jgi:hypothetical protein
MKTSILILFLCMMSLLLLGINPPNQSAVNGYSKQIMSPDGDYLNPAKGEIINVPLINATRDRNWRMTSITHQTDYDYNQMFEFAGRDDYYYNESFPDRIDSLVYSSFNVDSQSFFATSARRFFYDATGTNIIRVDWHYAQDAQNYVSTTIFEYDNQNRLIHQYEYNYDFDYNPQVLAFRYYWVYDEDSVIERYFTFCDDAGLPTSYTRTVFIHDEQKRNIGFTAFSSTDSLNWNNSNDCVATYHIHDTSTGQDMINYYHNAYIINYFRGTGGYANYTMIENFTVRVWTNGDWVNNNKTDYAYYDNDHLWYYVDSYVNPDWYTYDRYFFNFDNNNNVNMISSELRNTEDTDWLGLQQIHSLSYENVVSADDETAPGTAPGLNVYPNPFKDEITINLNSAEKGVFEAGIYNLKGQLVRSFTNQKGKSLIWDGKDKANNAAAAGLYFVRINQNRKSVVQKIVRVK